MKIISACLVFILLLFLIPLKILAFGEYNFHPASEGQVNEALQKLVPVRFLVSHPLYFLISFKEGINRFFRPSASKKAEFDLVLSGKKIKEAYLLFEKGDIKNSSRTLRLYSDRVEKMISQLEKTRSQNQEVASLVDLAAENLRIHETLFYTINIKRELMQDSYSFSDNFALAVSSYTKAISVLDGVKPGVKDRFGTTKNEATQEADPSPSPLGESIFESSPATRPRRIIL